MHTGSHKGLAVVKDGWKTVNTSHFCELALQRRACFVPGCANSGGVKEVQSFLPAILAVRCRDMGEVTVSNTTFFSEQLSQQAKQASLLEQNMK